MKENRSEVFRSIFLALIFLPLEIGLFSLYLISFIPLWGLLALHGFVVGVVSLFVRDCYNKREDLCYPILLLVSIFGAGPMGVFGFLLFSMLHPAFSKFSTPSEEWFEGLFPEQQQTLFSKIFQRIQSGWDDYRQQNEIAAFEDLFNFGSLTQKQAVLDAIIKDFDPIYAPILRRALKDDHNSVRIQAAAIVAKIDFDFEEELIKLIQTQKEKPDEAGNRYELARFYDRYFSLGILDNLRGQEICEKAIGLYREYLKTYPEDRAAWLAVARLLFYIKDYSGYIDWCDAFKQKFNDLPGILETWYQEALYRLNRFEDFIEFKRKF